MQGNFSPKQSIGAKKGTRLISIVSKPIKFILWMMKICSKIVFVVENVVQKFWSKTFGQKIWSKEYFF